MGGMTLRGLRLECATRRTEYRLARLVHTEVARLAVPDRTALERELREAMLSYYAAHGALHEALRRRRRLH